MKAVFALELEKIGNGYSKLAPNHDYAIDKDETSLFINITKILNCGEEYHLKIETLQNDGSTVEWLVLFTLKGLFKYCVFKFSIPQFLGFIF